MRVLLAALALASSLALAAAPALASCAPPRPVSELAARADAVVYARVVGFEGPPVGPPSRSAVVQVERVLKGSVPARIVVGIGPGGEAGPGSGPVATSVDYQMERGTDHTLYLKQNAPAGYTTDACNGSHAGPPNAEEERVLGTGRPPEPMAGGIDSASGTARVVAAVATLVAFAAGAAAIAYARRSARSRAEV